MATRATALPTFEVSKEGLAAQLARRPKSFIVGELAQNAWDENSTQVDVTLEDIGDGRYRLVVEDDNPEGFADLSHAYTLFAESKKKDDPSKRGRFNLGEKLVIALCEEVRIVTTKGSVLFTDGGRYLGKKGRASGSVFDAKLLMTEDEAEDCERFMRTLIVPANITTVFNMEPLPKRAPVATFDVTLRTEISDADGRLKPTTRKTTVELYEPQAGEVASIYELGIPVVETGDRFHVNVMQKVPLNTDRDNVPPAYLRDLRTAVVNNAAALLSPDDAKSAWVSSALEDPKIDAEAAKIAFQGRFGKKTVIFDPTDPEANKLAAAAGYTVIPGGALPKAAWKNVKSHGIASSAGKVTPSPKTHGDGPALKLMQPDHYPAAIERMVAFGMDYGETLLDRPVSVRIANDAKYPFLATYGTGQLTLNLGRLGFKWFDEIDEPQIDLLIHEFAHEHASDHLSESYYHALTALAARSVMIALRTDLFERHGVRVAITDTEGITT